MLIILFFMKLLKKHFTYFNTLKSVTNPSLVIFFKTKVMVVPDNFICVTSSQLRQIFKKSIFMFSTPFLFGNVFSIPFQKLQVLLNNGIQNLYYSDTIFLFKYNKKFYSSFQLKGLKKMSFYNTSKNLHHLLSFYILKMVTNKFFLYSK
jgi:hypothetical protein